MLQFPFNKNESNRIVLNNNLIHTTMKRFLNFAFALFLLILAVLAFICAKEYASHNVMLWLMGVVLGLGGIRFMCKD